MSLIIALTGIDGLVLSADSRTTEGYTLSGPKIRDDSIKFVQLNGSWGVLTYGLSEIGHAGITSLKNEISKETDSDSLALLLEKSTKILQKTSSDWSEQHSEIGRRDADVGFVIGGYDREEENVKTFSFQSPHFLPRRLNGPCFLGGQWHIARFLIQKFYAEEATAEMLKILAVFLLEATMTVEKTVGGEIRLATVTGSKGFRWVSEKEVCEIAESNKRFFRKFQEVLYASLLRATGSER